MAVKTKKKYPPKQVLPATQRHLLPSFNGFHGSPGPIHPAGLLSCALPGVLTPGTQGYPRGRVSRFHSSGHLRPKKRLTCAQIDLNIPLCGKNNHLGSTFRGHAGDLGPGGIREGHGGMPGNIPSCRKTTM